MRVRLIYNPVSGRRKSARMLADLKARLSDHGYMVDAVSTTGQGDAIRLAAETTDDVRAVIVSGGDGTIREVVTGLLGRSTPIVIWRRGTENVLAKHFQTGRRIDRIVDAVRSGRMLEYDLGVCNDQYFLLQVGVGFDADLVHRVNRRRKGHSAYRHWISPLLRAYVYHDYPPVRVHADDKVIYEGRALVWVGILPRYALGISLLPDASTDDGLLDVCVLPCDSRWQLTRHAVRMLFNAHLSASGVRYFRARRVNVEPVAGRYAPVQADGDSVGALPIDCKVIPRAVRFLLPNGTNATG